ncbi:MAG: hypothetical protein L0G46_02550 [Kocuria sp.]|nr:hypothetical protein [Kocuria sp.]
MTSVNPDEGRIAAATEAMRLLQRENELHEEAREAFGREWERRARVADLDADLVSYTGSPSALSVEIADFISIRNSETVGLEYYAYDHTAEVHVEISQEDAAARAGFLGVDVLEDLELPLKHAFHAARPYWEDARSVREAAMRSAAESVAEEPAVGSGAVEREDQIPVQEWTVTPERAQGTWIETTTRLRTLADTGQYTAVRNAIREMDSYLGDYVSGGTPPGSFDEEYLYMDALNREAVPLASEAPPTVLAEMRARGQRVPDFPDPEKVAEATGVQPMQAGEVERALTEPGKSPTPRSNEAVVFAREWHAATRGFDNGLVVSYDVPDAPGQALVERLDGDPNAYVSAMRGGPGEIVLTDVVGNEIEDSAFQERLELSDEGAAAVMSGLTNGLEAANELRTGGTYAAERMEAVPVADSVEDVTEQLRREVRAEPMPLHQMPSSGAAGTPGIS